MEDALNKHKFCVQPFRQRGKTVEAEGLREARDEASALRLGERLASTKAGVIVSKQRIDAELGDYGDPEILAIHGQVPLGYDGVIPF